MKRAALAALLGCLFLAGCGGHHKAQVVQPAQSAMGSVHPPGWGSTPPGFVLPPQLPRAVPTATMYDAVTLSNIPANPFAVAGYTAGLYVTWPALLRDFPSAHHVSIAIRASLHADCLDVEPGDALPSQAGAWVRADLSAGFRTPCIYSDLSNMSGVKASLAAAGLSRSQYLLWLAWYTGNPALPSGYDAIQYTDNALGRNLDANTVTLNFLRIAQPPYVPPPAYPVCFTHRIPANTCASARARVASQGRAAASSQRAYIARGCPGIVQRRDWFAAHVNQPPASKHAYRAGALATSRRAYNRESCGVFAQRMNFFTAAAAKLRAAN